MLGTKGISKEATFNLLSDEAALDHLFSPKLLVLTNGDQPVESSILSSVSLEAGLAAIQQERHQDAISILEAFCHDCAANALWTDRNYLQAQMHLVQTYAKSAQTERAAILCERLATCNNAQVQIWAQQTLKTLESVSAPTDEPSNKFDQPFAQPSETLSAFQLKNSLLLLFRKIL